MYVGEWGGGLHCGYKTLSDEWAERPQFALHRPGDRSGEGLLTDR